MLLLLVLPFATKWSTLIVFIHIVKLTLGRVRKLLGVRAWKRFTSGFSREEPVVSRFAETTAHSQRRGRSLGRAWYSWGDTHRAVTPTETRPSLFINVGRRGCAAGSFRHYYESARKPTILLFLSIALSNPLDFDAYRGRMTINWLDAWNRAIVNRLATIASSFCLWKGETLGIFVNSMNFDESWSKEGRFVIVRLWICLCTFASFF